MSIDEFSTVYAGLRVQTREVIASIAPAWRSANYGARYVLDQVPQNVCSTRSLARGAVA
jgi:hypothetical protein